MNYKYSIGDVVTPDLDSNGEMAKDARPYQIIHRWQRYSGGVYVLKCAMPDANAIETVTEQGILPYWDIVYKRIIESIDTDG